MDQASSSIIYNPCGNIPQTHQKRIYVTENLITDRTEARLEEPQDIET